MPVLTLSRQVGSGGDEIALAVAGRLGLRVIGRDIINQAARQAGVPEVALAEIDELGLLGLKPSQVDCQRYGAMVTQVIRSWAEQGDVLLLGRGSQVALADWPGVLRVRVIAPPAARCVRIQESRRMSAEVAAARLQTRDRARAAYLHKYFGRDPDDAELYDLVLNTAHLSPAVATEIICQAVVQVQTQATEVAA